LGSSETEVNAGLPELDPGAGFAYNVAYV